MLYRELLQIAEKEQVAINDNDLDKVEQYCSSKENIVVELETLKSAVMPAMSPEDAAESRAIMEKIIEINNANKESVHGMKDKLMEDMHGFRKRKKVIRAYSQMP